MNKLLLLFSLLLTAPVFAQSKDETAVRAAIDQMFTGMRKSDTTMVKSVFAPAASLQSVAKNKEGAVNVRQESIPGFITSIGKQTAGDLDERLTGYEIKIDAELAIAWTPYTFYYKGQKSHCGVNVFTLVKINGSWKIQSIIDTRRRDGC
nr:nuclear transport factor 2 family protein [uncultured Arsenicibacter sp.]